MSALTQRASGRIALLSLALVAIAALLFTALLPAGANELEPIEVQRIDGDACRSADLLDFGVDPFSVDAFPVVIPRGGNDSPVFSQTLDVPGGGTIEVTAPSNRKFVEFTATGVDVQGAIYFNRNNQRLGNLYDYRPGMVSSGTIFPPPKDSGQAKKVVFCFNSKAEPTISTTATANATVGDDISDTATLTDGDSPTGNVTFKLFADSQCATQPIAVLTGAVQADGTASSGDYPTTAAGTYYWIASYEGDDNNKAVAGTCGEPGETTMVAKASPTVTTLATSTVEVGGQISDTATLAGGYNAGGTLSFAIYSDAACGDDDLLTTFGPITVNGDDDYSSGPYTTKAAGKYYWIASYTGDSNNDPVAGVCDSSPSSTQISTATPATPSLSTIATQTAVIGDDISDTATLAGGYNAGGTLSFAIYNDAACGVDDLVTTLGPITVNGDDDYSSGAYTLPATLEAAGTYYWIASYTGDNNNAPTEGACGDEGEVTTVYEFNAKCGVPISRTDATNASNSAMFVRPEGSTGCNEEGNPEDDTDKFGSIGFFVSDGTPAVELLLSGDGEQNAKFVGEVAFDTSGLTSIPIIKIDDDENGEDNFRPMEWFTGATPTLTFDTLGNFIDADFECPVTENWCILEATISRDATTWKVGGLGVDPKWKF